MIYIVEDDASIRELEQYALQTNGYEATGCEDGASFWAALRGGTPDLVILDVMLPDEDGYQILAKLRDDPATQTVPVMMVTAKTSEIDVVKGLDHGADDYLCKPFGIMEFLARVRAQLRRGEQRGTLASCGVTLDPAARRVELAGREISLTAKEFDLLEYLMRRAGAVVRREELLGAVWGYSGGEETRTVDVHIRALRLKLGEAGTMIKTVRGVGYMAEK